MTLRMGYPNPTHGRAGVASSRIKLLESKFRRLRLYLFQLYLRGNLSLGMPCTALQPTSKPSRPRKSGFAIQDAEKICNIPSLNQLGVRIIAYMAANRDYKGRAVKDLYPGR